MLPYKHAVKAIFWNMNALLGLLALAGALLVVQWKAISDLERQISERDAITLGLHPEIPGVNDTVAPEIHPASSAREEESSQLRRENKHLSAQVRDLAAQAVHTEPLIPGREQGDAAYFGPGRWVRMEADSFFDEAIISVDLQNNMVIRVRAGEGVWPELRVEPVRCPPYDPAFSYKRGLASWDGLLDSMQLLFITFQRDGLRIEWLRVPKTGSDIHPMLKICKLIRATG